MDLFNVLNSVREFGSNAVSAFDIICKIVFIICKTLFMFFATLFIICKYLSTAIPDMYNRLVSDPMVKSFFQAGRQLWTMLHTALVIFFNAAFPVCEMVLNTMLDMFNQMAESATVKSLNAAGHQMFGTENYYFILLVLMCLCLFLFYKLVKVITDMIISLFSKVFSKVCIQINLLCTDIQMRNKNI